MAIFYPIWCAWIALGIIALLAVIWRIKETPELGAVPGILLFWPVVLFAFVADYLRRP
jgi:hypothetical protein